MPNPLKDIVSLVLPPRCAVCGKVLGDNESFICNTCRWNAPLTGYCNEVDNPVVERFWGLVKVVNACSFMRFVHESPYRDMIHDFKYHGMWRSAYLMGEWFGSEIARGGLYADVDVVIPVPLHYRKVLRRGYNQSEYLARGIARSLSVGVDCRSVVRRKYNKSQALKPHHERWENVEGIFDVRHAESLRGKHILLVDDVLTTGATICSCAESIERLIPDCRLSIATLAVAGEDYAF